MKKLYALLLMAALIVSAQVWTESAEAQNSQLRQASQTVKNINKFQRRLGRQMKRLSQAQLIALIQGDDTTVDSDNDGVPDVIEEGNGSSVCDDDSDDDGVDDGDEIEHGTNPGDPDSDDDGIDDFSEVEVKGAIAELSATTIGVGGQTFALTEATQYLGKNNTPLQASDFAVGECVEVEGHRAADQTVVASKVKKDDDCAGVGGGDNEVEVKGAIAGLDASTITVAGQTFVVTDETSWLVKKNPVQQSDFAVGDCVEVKGVSGAGGVLQAVRVKSDDDC